MKSIKKIITGFRNLLAVLTLCFLQTAVWAQDGGTTKVDINVNKNGGNWYTQPWVWVVGGAVFLLLLVALLRGGNNKS